MATLAEQLKRGFKLAEDEVKRQDKEAAPKKKPVKKRPAGKKRGKTEQAGVAGVGAESSERSPQCYAVWGLPSVDPSHPDQFFNGPRDLAVTTHLPTHQHPFEEHQP